MATAHSALRRMLAESLGDYRSLSATSNGTNASIIDAKLARYAESNDAFPYWHVIITQSGSNEGQTRPVKRTGGYTASTTTLVPTDPLPAAVDSGHTYELYRIDPADYKAALNAASRLLWPALYKPVRDTTLMVDRIGSNMDFQTFAASNFTGWALSGAGASVAEETSRVWHGSRAAKITAGGGAAARYEQDLFSLVNIREQTRLPLHLECAIWASAASAARLAVTFDGTYTGDGFKAAPYHRGRSEWEGPHTMRLDANIPTDATEMSIVLEVAAGEVAVFGYVMARVAPVYRYAIPASLGGEHPRRIEMQADKQNPQSPYYPLGLTLPEYGHRLQVSGMAPLSEVDDDDDEMEVEGRRAELLIARAAQWLFDSQKYVAGSSVRDARYRDSQDAAEHVERLLNTRGVPMRGMGGEYPKNWRMDEANGVFEFQGYRGG